MKFLDEMTLFIFILLALVSAAIELGSLRKRVEKLERQACK